MKLRVRASRFLIIPLLVLTIFSSFFETAAVASSQAKSRPDEAALKGTIQIRAKAANAALKQRDWKSLAQLVHPNRGVRCSPYSHVDLKTDRIFSATQVRGFGKDQRRYLWGNYDGSGEPIQLTVAQYFKRFVYSHDFSAAKQISYNRIIGHGNTLNNNFQVYPKAIIVEYHFPGFNPEYQGMDWESLRLIFAAQNGRWYLVGIGHDQWTI